MPFLTKHLSALLGHALIDRAFVERQSAKFGAPCRTFSTNRFTEQNCPGSNYDGRRAELPGKRRENRGDYRQIRRITVAPLRSHDGGD
jgi:hypothetical protein